MQFGSPAVLPLTNSGLEVLEVAKESSELLWDRSEESYGIVVTTRSSSLSSSCSALPIRASPDGAVAATAAGLHARSYDPCFLQHFPSKARAPPFANCQLCLKNRCSGLPRPSSVRNLPRVLLPGVLLQRRPAVPDSLPEVEVHRHPTPLFCPAIRRCGHTILLRAGPGSEPVSATE